MKPISFGSAVLAWVGLGLGTLVVFKLTRHSLTRGSAPNPVLSPNVMFTHHHPDLIFTHRPRPLAGVPSSPSAAPSPPSQSPTDNLDALVRHNLDQLNTYRAQAGVPPLTLDAGYSTFAQQGSEQLSRDHAPHAHMSSNTQTAMRFGTSLIGENQGDPNGFPPTQAGVDQMLKLMMDEGPGGGHHDNIVNPRFRKVGIGLAISSGRMYLTNDLAD